MTSESCPIGAFTCDVALRRIRAPHFVREDKQGVTYLVACGYEIAYEATLRFIHGAQLSIQARLVGELNQRVVIRDARGCPVRMSGYVQGLLELNDTQGRPIFRGRYYDSRTVQSLAGDEALTPVGPSIVNHWENGFGEGPYAGHAFSMGVELAREGEGPLRGEGHGQID